MKNSDEAVARVLAGLRDVEAAEGLEQRVQERLEERAARRSGWMGLRSVLPAHVGVRRWVLWRAAFAGVVVIGVAVPVVRRVMHAPVATKIGVESGASLRREPLATTRGPLAVIDDAASVPQRVKGRVAERVGTRVVADGRRADVARVDVVGAEDSAAVSERRGESFPAPPMPLTEQEKLLLRIAHKGDPVEVAILDPKMRSLQEMEEMAEYQKFFARPVIEQPSANGVAQPSAVEQQGGQQQKEQQQIPYGDDDQKNNGSAEQAGPQQPKALQQPH